MNSARTLAALPTCTLAVRSSAAGVIEEIRFCPPGTAIEAAQSNIERQFVAELAEYLAHPDHSWKLPLAARGTAFQQRVWALIRAIPAGSSRTYGALAAEIESAPRAVGQACGANPFPLATPCHRVCARTGSGGFAHARDGWLIETKRWLLAHEAARA